MEIEQWTAGADDGVHNFAEDDGVIAGFEDPGFAALQGGERAGDDRRAGDAFGPIDIVETLIGLEGERGGEVSLRSFENVYGEGCAEVKMREQGAVGVHANEHERGNEGHGSEGADGQSVRIAMGVAGGGDGHTGGEMSARLAKCFGRYRDGGGEAGNRRS